MVKSVCISCERVGIYAIWRAGLEQMDVTREQVVRMLAAFPDMQVVKYPVYSQFRDKFNEGFVYGVTAAARRMREDHQV